MTCYNICHNITYHLADEQLGDTTEMCVVVQLGHDLQPSLGHDLQPSLGHDLAVGLWLDRW